VIHQDGSGGMVFHYYTLRHGQSCGLTSTD